MRNETSHMDFILDLKNELKEVYTKNKHYSKPITDFSVEQIIELFLNRMIEEMELVKNEKRIIFYNKCYNLHKCKKK